MMTKPESSVFSLNNISRYVVDREKPDDLRLPLSSREIHTSSPIHYYQRVYYARFDRRLRHTVLDTKMKITQ